MAAQKFETPVLTLDISSSANHIKISAVEKIPGETQTAIQYEDHVVNMATVDKCCHDLISALNNSNRRGRIPRQVLQKIQEIGLVLQDELFTTRIKDMVRQSQAHHLILQIDDQLVHIPWELLHDSQQFLCQRYSIGRLVKTQQRIAPLQLRSTNIPLRMLIIADPRGELVEAHKEGLEIRNLLERHTELVDAIFRSDGIDAKFLKEKIRQFDWIHFSGHARYDLNNPARSNWQMSAGEFSAEEIIKMAGTAPMPAIIFANACQSARNGRPLIPDHIQTQVFGLANAFILAGVKHYVGTFWEILDEPAKRFALTFYEHLLTGISIGSALHNARKATIQNYGEETLIWASYLLYGDPTTYYIKNEADDKSLDHSQDQKQPPSEEFSKVEIQPLPHSPNRDQSNRIKKVLFYALIFLLITGAGSFVGFFWTTQSKANDEQKALFAFQNGDFDVARPLSEQLTQKNPARSLAFVLLGNIALVEGRLEASRTYYSKALKCDQGPAAEKAEALVGLGRIASETGNNEDALNYYRKAANQYPESDSANLAQIVLLINLGKYDAAIAQINKLRNLSMSNDEYKILIAQINSRLDKDRIKERQQRVGQLITELETRLEKNPKPAQTEALTPRPLTLWIMDFETTGYSLQEGQAKLLLFGIMNELTAHSRVRVVERALIEEFMDELKLATSKLADQTAALSLGRILAARLILASRIVYDGPMTDVTMRLIETETGEVTAVVNKTFEGQVSFKAMANQLSHLLINELNKGYPLDAKVVEIKGDTFIIDTGSNHGIAVGMQFQDANAEFKIEITDVESNKSTAKILKKAGNIEPTPPINMILTAGDI